MPRHVTGSKITGSHTTTTDAAEIVVKAAKNYPEVTKIVLGEITSRGGGQRRLKLTPINGGWRVQVRGPTSVQIIIVYTSSSMRTKKALEGIFSTSGS